MIEHATAEFDRGISNGETDFSDWLTTVFCIHWLYAFAVHISVTDLSLVRPMPPAGRTIQEGVEVYSLVS